MTYRFFNFGVKLSISTSFLALLAVYFDLQTLVPYLSAIVDLWVKITVDLSCTSIICLKNDLMSG